VKKVALYWRTFLILAADCPGLRLLRSTLQVLLRQF
jgi:hypothetical protein